MNEFFFLFLGFQFKKRCPKQRFIDLFKVSSILTTPLRPCIFAVTLKIEILQTMVEPITKTILWERSANPNLFDELHLVDALSAQVLISPEGKDKWLVTGSLSGVQLLTCVRSLEQFKRPFETDLAIEVERTQRVAKQEVNDEDEEVFTILIPIIQSEVDISECVRQLILLQEPLNPMKNPDEEFICPGSESSEEPAVDLRWEKLKALKRKMENSNRS